MSWLEQKYVGLLASRLQQFERKDDNLWNFRCPLCGDSKKSKTKARGYIYEGKTKALRYSCKNCHANISLRKLIETLDYELFKAYLRDTFAERGQPLPTVPISQRPVDISKFHRSKVDKYSLMSNPLVTKVSSLHPEHFCKKYVVERQIPNKWHAKIYFTDQFKKLTNTKLPGKFKEPIERDEPRLIIPFVDENQKLFGYQGRSFKGGEDPFKYISIFFEDEHIRLFGIDEYKSNKRAYLFEGPIDAMFIENGLAMAGGSIDPRIKIIGLNNTNVTVVYDNERRNKDIIRRMEDAIEQGYSICVWPDDVKQKDINDMIRAGMISLDIQKIIDTNTYSGLQACFKITQWKRINNAN